MKPVIIRMFVFVQHKKLEPREKMFFFRYGEVSESVVVFSCFLTLYHMMEMEYHHTDSTDLYKHVFMPSTAKPFITLVLHLGYVIDLTRSIKLKAMDNKVNMFKYYYHQYTS